ncbi:MAG: hypothetical protein K2F74_08540 [Muribaculaceae bacterium]|nr:hypothetical protein [Muribaculaceae bacterium]
MKQRKNRVCRLLLSLVAFMMFGAASAYDVKVYVVVEETGDTVQKATPVAIRPDGVFVCEGQKQADGGFLFSGLPEEELYTGFFVDNSFLCEVAKPGKDSLIVKISEETLQKLTKAEELAELKVEGRTQYTEGNKTTFIPTKDEKRISRGGIELLRTMSLSSLRVNPIDNSVTNAAGGGVALFIDMQPATQAEVENLRSMDIQTIEYLESPSDPRFQGAIYAVNYVLVKYEYGGYTGVYANQRFIDNVGSYNLYSRNTVGKMLYDFGGGFSYNKKSHAGQDNVSVYNFPDFSIERTTTDKGGKRDSRSGFGTFKALYQTSKLSIANTVGLSGGNTPRNVSFGNVSYSPEYFPDEESSKYSHQSNFSVVWDGNYFFTLPYEMALNVSTQASYARYRRAFSYIEGDVFANDSRDRTGMYIVGVNLKKKIGSQSVGLRVSSNGSWNHINYTGNVNSEVSGRMLCNRLYAVADLSYGKFWSSLNVGMEYDSQKVSGVTDNSLLPKMFVQGGYNFSPQSSLTLYSNYAPSVFGTNEKSDNLVILNSLDAVRGNPLLKYTKLFNIGTIYKFSPNRKFDMSAHWTFNRISNLHVYTYEPEIYQGMPLMVRNSVNCGFRNTHDYGLNLAYSLLNSKLIFSASVNGHTDARHSVTNYSGTSVDFFGNVLYTFGNFYIQAMYQSKRKSITSVMEFRNPAYYRFDIGWGNGNLYITAQAINPTVSNYKGSIAIIDTPTYSSWTQDYNDSSHRFFALHISYNFSYGKKIQHGQQIGELKGGGSGILNY